MDGFKIQNGMVHAHEKNATGICTIPEVSLAIQIVVYQKV